MIKDYIPGVHMHEDSCLKEEEEIEAAVRAVTELAGYSEQCRFPEKYIGKIHESEK